MTEQTENEGNPPEPKSDDVRTMIREELKAILPELTASLTKTGEPATDSEEENESATSKMIERSAKKAVEEAMVELRKLVPKTSTPKKEPEGETEKPKPEPTKEKETAPEDTGKKKFNLQKLIWGE